MKDRVAGLLPIAALFLFKYRNMNIRINDTDYCIKWTLRAFFIYEQITGKIFKMQTLTDEYVFIYCLLLANNPEIQLTFNEFIDVLDEEVEVLKTLKEFIGKEMAKQAIFTFDTTEDAKKKN